MIAPPTSAGTSAFLGRPEEHVGTLGAFLGLGGMWNAAAVPASRNVGFAVAGVILTALLVRWIPRRWLVVSAVAVLVFCVLWRWPGLVAHIPGLALFRDSQKLALFLIPGLVMAAGRIGAACPTRLRSGVVSGVVALLAVLQVPDAPVALMALRPLPEPAIVREVQAAEPTGDVANMDSAGLVVYAGRTVIDPLYKAVGSVEAGHWWSMARWLIPPRRGMWQPGRRGRHATQPSWQSWGCPMWWPTENSLICTMSRWPTVVGFMPDWGC